MSDFCAKYISISSKKFDTEEFAQSLQGAEQYIAVDVGGIAKP